MTFDRWLALTALLFSIPSVVLSILSYWRQRHRVEVQARAITAGVPAADSTAVLNHTYLSIAVRNFGGAVTVEDIRVESPDDGGVVQIGSLPDPLVGTGAGAIPPSHFGEGAMLADGETRLWAVTVHPPGLDYSPPFHKRPAVKVVAIASLSTGKEVRSAPAWISPTILAGESAEDPKPPST